MVDIAIRVRRIDIHSWPISITEANEKENTAAKEISLVGFEL